MKDTVIVDETFFGSPTKDKKRERGTKKAAVLVAVSIDEKCESLLFVKMKVVENMKESTVKESITDMVKLDSILRTDSHKTLMNLDDFKHQVVNMTRKIDKAQKAFYWIHVIISNAKTYISGTYHCLPAKYLQRYLDEFCYRLNRRFCEPVIFDKLVQACFICSSFPIAERSL